MKSSSVLPKISRNLAYRTLALVIVVGSLVYGLEWFLKVRSDLGGLESSNTVGWISAVQYGKDGRQQAVLISPDGTIHKDPGHTPESTDRDVTWSPNGNFLYFVSDRAEHNYNLYRWNPGSGKAAEQRTIGTRARGNLRFPAQSTNEADSVAKGLLTTGGVVQEFDPSNMSTAQVLPPTQKEITVAKGDDSGTEGQFEGVYGSLGTSFREAQWCGNHKFIVAVMPRESGETLVLQEMEAVDGKFPQPRQLMTGEHIEFTVNPKDGSVVYCVQGFQWPEGAPPADKDGQPRKKPFINGLGVFDITNGKPILLAANQGDLIYSAPTINPSGSVVAVVLEKVIKGEVKTDSLTTYPTTADANFKPLRIQADIHEPSWSADGIHMLVAVRLPGKHRAIYEIATDGSAPPRNITGEDADFGFPHYSPQQKSG